MPTYILDNVNSGNEIKNPKIKIKTQNDDWEGNASFEVVMSMAPLLSTRAASVSITLDGFTYIDSWTRDEATEWVMAELGKKEKK